jgi:hypothetical protein
LIPISRLRDTRQPRVPVRLRAIGSEPGRPPWSRRPKRTVHRDTANYAERNKQIERCALRCEDAVSNVFRNQCRWFPVPHALYKNGHLRDLGGSAVKLYDLLMALAQEHSAVKLELPAYKASDLAGLTAETVPIARRELEAAGLVTCKKGEHGVMTYVLLNPETQVPLPPPEGRSGFLRHRPTPGRSARTVRKQLRVEPVESTETVAPSWDDLGKTESTTRKQNTDNPLPHSEPDNGKSVSTTRKIREHDTENPLPPTMEAPENACLNAGPRSLKPSLKKGFSEQREVSTEKASGEKGTSMSCESERVREGDPDLRLMPCYVHRGRTPHWKRGEDWLCGLCRPNPAEVAVR